MNKKIIIGLLLTITILAFPIRLLGLSDLLELTLRILKGLLYTSIIFSLLRRENLLKKFVLFNSPSRDILKKLIPALCVLILYTLLNWTKFDQAFKGYTTLLSLTIIATFILAFAEEIFFRGYLYNIFKKEGFSSYKSIIISSLLFAGIHSVNVFRYDDIWSVINQVVFAIFVGMLLCSIFALTRNIFIASLFHFAINLPSALSSLIQTKNQPINIPIVSSFSENLLSTLLFVALMSPVIMLSLYYTKLTTKEDVQKDNNL